MCSDADHGDAGQEPPVGTHTSGLPDRGLDGLAAHELRSAFDDAPIGMALLRPDGVVLAVNQALARLLRREHHELVGDTLFGHTHPADVEAARLSCSRMQAGATRILRHESRFLTGVGDVVTVLISTSRPADMTGRPPHLIMHIEDITDRKRLEEDLRRRATHDALTGLANRTLLLDRIQHALTHGARARTSTAVFFLDLNGFKQVNDELGHAAGDDVLVQLANRLTAVLRADDTAARLGGDEFAVLCQDTDSHEAAILASRLRTATSSPFMLVRR